MSEHYRVAIVGCGGIGNAHATGYERLDNVKMVAVVDPHEGARQTYQQQYDIPKGYATVEEMLDAEKPDIVSICTWHLLHAPLTVSVARSGVKGIICEKPMAIGSGEADRMIEACEASGTKLVISHQRRFTPGWIKARDLVAEGAIGKPIFAKNKVAEGLTNWGTHSIDGTRFALGDPHPEWVMGSVERKTDRHERDVAIEDACMGLVTFNTGVQLFIQSDLFREGASAGVFQIEGEDGLIDVNTSRARLLTSSSGGWRDIDFGAKKVSEAGEDTNAAQVEELIAWIEGGPEHRGSGRQARVTVDIMMAIYESARKHAVVRFPLEEKGYPLGLMIDEGKLPVEEKGRYDIRSFLLRDQTDETEYAKLQAEGLPHHVIMRRLSEKA